MDKDEFRRFLNNEPPPSTGDIEYAARESVRLSRATPEELEEIASGNKAAGGD
jgi:hypothetical protein